MLKSATMKIFEFAVKMERDGERLYRDMSARSSDPGLQTIFDGLADDEAKHARALLDYEQHAEPGMARTAILKTARNVFAGMAAAKRFAAAGTEQKALYRQALDIERRSRDLYEAQAGAAREVLARRLFRYLADEESRHMRLIENMIEFISRPETWLENAEFNHLEEY